ncbi:hypothetical protein SV7mr_39490 [Stieleria bergensis]|uniref:Uncharacterized protein n=1 Tax=Stieleria bergensis TaxID=2528025 RepID=A0A517SZ37_9BACT|nr:hypothetical protein SV7mr_39490 [Planctomycetes bacterium SV_7m_r]
MANDGIQGVDAPVAWYTPQVAVKLADQESNATAGKVNLVKALRALYPIHARTIVITPKANQPPPASFRSARSASEFLHPVRATMRPLPQRDRT